MKRIILTLSTIMMLLNANAASINWSVGGSASRVINGVFAESKDATTATNGSTPLSSTVYLLVADDVSGLTGNTSKDSFLSNLETITVNKAYSTSDGKKPSVSNLPITSSLITTTEQTYGLLVFAEDSFGNGWYKMATAKGTGYATGASADAQTNLATSWNNVYSAGWTKAYTAPVPEPSTAVLALAGLALLLKRRRA